MSRHIELLFICMVLSHREEKTFMEMGSTVYGLICTCGVEGAIQYSPNDGCVYGRGDWLGIMKTFGKGR